MTWKEWKGLFRFERTVDGQGFSIVCMCPYAFARVLWYSTSKEFKAWPNALETGYVYGWRWPWQKTFREKKQITLYPMPLAIYSAMDMVYLARAAKDLGMDPPALSMEAMRYVGSTIRNIVQREPKCAHNYWIASCPNCARKTLVMLIETRGKLQGDTRTLYESEAQRILTQGAEREAAHMEAVARFQSSMASGAGALPTPEAE